MNLKLFLLLTLFSAGVYSQHRIEGNVIDKEQKALPYASVRLLKTDSTYVSGMTTDSLGYYRFANVASNEYLLAFSTIGYKPQIIPVTVRNADVRVPTVTLESDDVMLGEIVVKGSSFIQKKDHLLVIPDKQQAKHAFTGYDLLYNLMIPGLTVDRKNKKVTALAGEATLYINGVKADMKEVQSLRPQDIKKVEYYVWPTSGKFAGDAASVNYLVKNYSKGGYITMDGEQTIGYLHGDYNVGAKLSKGNTNYSFFGGYAMAKYNGNQIDKHENLYLSDFWIDRTTTNESSNYRNSQQYAQIKLNNSNQKRDLSASVSFVRNDTPDDDRNESLIYQNDENRNSNSFEGKDNESMQAAIKLNGVFYLNEHQQLKARLNGSYAQNAYQRIYDEDNRYSLTHTDEDFYAFDAQLAYLYEVNPGNTFYGRITHFHNITSMHYKGDHPSWQHLWNGETLFQVDYTHIFSKRMMLVLSPGASWLNYKLHGEETERRLNLRLNTAFRYAFPSKQWIMAVVAWGNNQPDISYLNTSTQTVDFYQVKRGNPYLDNTQMLTVLMMYQGSFHPLLNIEGKASFVRNWHNIYAFYQTEKNQLVHTYASADGYNAATIELAISSRITDNFRTNLRLKYGYMYVPEHANLYQHNFSGSLDLNYFFRSFSVNAYAKTQERMLDQTSLAFIRTPASYGLSIRYSGKNWMAEAGTENPFTKHARYKEHADYGVYKYNQIQTSRINQQTGYVKVAYTFDFGRKTSRDKNDVDRKINSAIMKVN